MIRFRSPNLRRDSVMRSCSSRSLLRICSGDSLARSFARACPRSRSATCSFCASSLSFLRRAQAAAGPPAGRDAAPVWPPVLPAGLGPAQTTPGSSAAPRRATRPRRTLAPPAPGQAGKAPNARETRESVNATLEPRTETEAEYLRLIVGLLYHEGRQIDVYQAERGLPGNADAGAQARRAGLRNLTWLSVGFHTGAEILEPGLR